MRVSSELATVIQEIVLPDTGGQASLRTGISRGYWSDLFKGKVPRPEALERIIEGYKDRITPEQIRRLYEAAGYDLPAKYASLTPSTHIPEDDPVKRVRFALNGQILDEEQYRELLSVLEMHMRAQDAKKDKN